MPDTKKKDNLAKMDLVQLKETLQRENNLLKNTKLIEKLPDKGESIKKFREQVKKEIKYREDLQTVEEAITKLSLDENVNHEEAKSSLDDNDKHAQKLCQIEKVPEKERYKPFSTLNKVKEVQSTSNAFKMMEDCSHNNKPTKLINLPESMDILKKQDERIKEEQVKARYRRVIEKLRELDEKGIDEQDGSSGEYSEVEEEGQG